MFEIALDRPCTRGYEKVTVAAGHWAGRRVGNPQGQGRTPVRRKPSRRAGAVVTAAAAALVASGAVVTTAPAASAAVCDTHVHVLCGAVNNRTGRTMSITLNLGQGSG